MNFFRIASQSKLTALAALAAGGVLLAACDSTVEGGSGTGGAGGGESSATGISQGGGPVESSSVSAAGGASPGGANAIALFAYELDGGVQTTVSVGVGAGGGSSGEGGYGSAVASVGSGSGQGGNGTSAVSVGSGEGQGGYGSAASVGSGQGGYGSAVSTGSGEGGYGSAVSTGYGEGGYGSAVSTGSGEGGWSSSSVGGGYPAWDPNRLFLFISDDLVECADPYDFEGSCGPRQFTAEIGLPVEYQQVGTYSLNDPAITAGFSAWEGDGQECMGEGGSFFDGTIEVISIDAHIVRVRLSGTSPSDVDGVHDVLRCSSSPTPPPLESSVLAYFPSGLPPQQEDGGESSSVTTGTGNPGDESFIINFANHAQVCSNVYGGQPAPGQTFEDFNIHLPPSYLVPGTYSLDDPAITTTRSEWSENAGSIASGAPGNEIGTLTIFQVTDSFIDLELEGTQFDFANGAGQVPRCD